jgi:Cytidylate kinase
MIIAVDGPAAAGKGTIARALAEHYGLPFLDTGLLYRMVGRAVLDEGEDPRDSAAAITAARCLDPSRYKDADLRSEAVGDAASVVAVIPEVREALLGFQRNFAGEPPGAVLDGAPAAGPASSPRPGCPPTIRRSWRISVLATSATAGESPPPWFPLPTPLSSTPPRWRSTRP